MSLSVFALVALAAFMHVVWNALVKACENKASFAWITSLIGNVILLPFFIFSLLWRPGPLGPAVWSWAALSGLFEALYFIVLFSAYTKTDLSVVYPMSRGTAPLITMSLGGQLVGDQVSLASASAVALVVTGVSAVAFSSRPQGGLEKRVSVSGLVFSLLTGCMIGGYHLVDRQAMSMEAAPSLVEYLFIMQLFQTLFLSLWIYCTPARKNGLFCAWDTDRRSAIAVGICAPLTYTLILLALRFGNVTYITAGRNVGIVISTLVGALFLKEKMGWSRIAGAILIASGVACLVLLGPQD